MLLDQRPVELFLRYANARRRTPADLRQVLVPNAQRRPIPLGLLARIESLASYPQIEHQHGLRSLTLTAEIDGNPLAVIHRLVDAAIAALGLPEDIQWGYTGEYGELLRTVGGNSHSRQLIGADNRLGWQSQLQGASHPYRATAC